MDETPTPRPLSSPAGADGDGFGGHDPAPQHFCDAPGLGHASTGREGGLRIEDLADRAEARLAQVRDQTLEKAASTRTIPRMDAEPRLDEGSEEPGPYRPLMIGRIARPQVAVIPRLVIRIIWGERA